MRVYKNKASGKNFIFIQHTGNNEGLFITPTNEKGEVAIKSLKFNLFAEAFLDDEDENLVSSGAVSNEQFLRLAQFEKDRSEEIIDNAQYAFEQLTPWQQKELIEKLTKGI